MSWRSFHKIEETRADVSRESLYGPTLYKIAADSASKYGNREFVYDGTRRMSFAQLKAAAEILGAKLSEMGLGEQDVAVVCIPNWVEFIQTYAAVSACGAILAVVPADTKRVRMGEIVDLVNPKVVFAVMEEQLDALDDVGYEGPVIGVHLHDERCIPYESLFDYDALTYFTQDERGTDAAEAPDYKCEGFEPKLETLISTIVFTSGMTGSPKGVMSLAKGHKYVSDQIVKCILPQEGDAAFIPIPYCHIFGVNNGLVIPLMSGMRLVLTDLYSPTRAVNLINDEGCTIQFGVPTMFSRQLKLSQELGVPYGLRLGIIGGAAIPPGFVEDIEVETGCRLLPSYGMTESTGGITLTYYDDDAYYRYCTDGCPIDGAQVKIIGSDGEEMQAGQVGEICVNTPGIMAGYYTGGPFKVDTSLQGAWFKTGDLGSLEESGYLHISGRIKDVIMRGGITIFPGEIECVFTGLPYIQEVCLVGIPDQDLGEKTCLAVVIENGFEGLPEASAEGLMQRAKDNLERHKVPDKVVILDSFPKLPSGKINKRALVEELQAV